MLIWDWQYTVFTPQIPETEFPALEIGEAS